jgi:hypothetical protein
MAYRYTTEERIFGGSMAPRLNPKICNTGLNAKIGTSNLPSPLVRGTGNDRAIAEQGKEGRLDRTGFKNKKDY